MPRRNALLDVFALQSSIIWGLLLSTTGMGLAVYPLDWTEVFWLR
jgi:hypothetical protein